MVIVIVAAATVAAFGVYKAGKLTLPVLKTKVEEQKKTKDLKKRETEQRDRNKRLEAERQERVNSVTIMRSKEAAPLDRINAINNLRSGSRRIPNRLLDTNDSDSIKERLATYKCGKNGVGVSSNTCIKNGSNKG
jgi:hypothetical protein